MCLHYGSEVPGLSWRQSRDVSESHFSVLQFLFFFFSSFIEISLALLINGHGSMVTQEPIVAYSFDTYEFCCTMSALKAKLFEYY